MKLPGFIAIAGLAFLPTLTIAQTINNGSFNGFTGNKNSNNGIIPSGWTRAIGHPDTYNENTTLNGSCWSASPDGGDFVTCAYVNNYPSSGLVWTEGISQTVSGFTVGNLYTLSFEQACTYIGGRNQPGDMGFFQVNIGGTIYDSTSMAIPASGVPSPWQTETIQFIANAETMDLTFSAAGIGDVAAMGIDGVSLAPVAVPEPTFASLFGLVGSLALLRRKRVCEKA